MNIPVADSRQGNGAGYTLWPVMLGVNCPTECITCPLDVLLPAEKVVLQTLYSRVSYLLRMFYSGVGIDACWSMLSRYIQMMLSTLHGKYSQECLKIKLP